MKLYLGKYRIDINNVGKYSNYRLRKENIDREILDDMALMLRDLFTWTYNHVAQTGKITKYGQVHENRDGRLSGLDYWQDLLISLPTSIYEDYKKLFKEKI